MLPAPPAAGNDVEPRYAVFLRGVNVGGVSVRMADLREELSRLPMTDIGTVLASGNVVCSSRLTAGELEDRVEEALRGRFGYPARVIVVARPELIAIAAAVPRPLDGAPASAATAVHTYLTLFTGPAELSTFLDDAGELADEAAVLPGGTALAWFCPKGQSTDVPLAKLLAKARHAAVCTTRNITTVDKVVLLLR